MIDSNIAIGGVIAQEVKNLLPDVISFKSELYDETSDINEPLNKNGNPLYYYIDYSKFTPYILKGLQEAYDRIEQQAITIESLQRTIVSMNMDISFIKESLKI